jgi:hypothetical protein
MRQSRRQFISLVAGAAVVAATLPAMARFRCRNCGAPTDFHLIDCSLPYETSTTGIRWTRTFCFSCTPEARVIDHYWYGMPSVLHAFKNNTKCSECGVGRGYIHVRGADFNYRLCGNCAPEAKDCRRWVRDRTGNDPPVVREV